jgi:Zn finger protein HypA/HybF involved in hydrogenase expression/extradiol dioxygenase family protein
MFKSIICLTVILALVSAQNYNQEATDLLNGLFNKVGLPNATAIPACFDTATSQGLVTLIGTILQQAIADPLKAMTQITAEVTAFNDSIPASVKQCLAAPASLAEITGAEVAYKVAGLTPAAEQSKFAAYALFHLAAVKADLVQMQSSLTAGQFYAVGGEAGALAKAVFGVASSLKAIEDPNANTCALLTGLYTQAGLAAPSVICACFDETTSQNLLNLIAEILQQASSGSISALTQIEAEIEAFNATIPAAVQTCLAGSGPQASITSALTAYHLAGLTPAQIQSKAESYILFHLAAVVAQVKQTQSDFNAGNFNTAGMDAGKLVQNIFGASSLKAIEDANSNACALLDGVFTQAALGDPTVVCACFDETTSQNLLNLIGQVLQQASSGSISALTQIMAEIEAFNATIPAAVQTCLAGSGPQAALASALTAYHLAGLTPAQIQSKAEAYILFHLAAVVAQIKQTQSDFNAGNFQTAGMDAGKLVQSVFGTTLSMKFENDGETNYPICQLFNGVWEQANLADTTVICSCFDAPTAAALQTLIGTILQQASSGSLSAITQIVKEIDAFNATIPAAVSTCLAGAGPTAALTQFEQAYHIYGLTEAQIESKVESYAVFHLSTIVKDIGQTNTDYKAAQYDAAGKEAGVLIQAVFGGSVTE